MECIMHGRVSGWVGGSERGVRGNLMRGGGEESLKLNQTNAFSSPSIPLLVRQ